MGMKREMRESDEAENYFGNHFCDTQDVDKELFERQFS